MLSLRPVDHSLISKYFVDLQKKSHCYELPPEGAEFLGIYNDETLIGYFIVQGFEDGDVEINQGYLMREYRHLALPSACMEMLENICKAAGYKRVLLGTHNRFRSYLKFAKTLGYKPNHLIFVKEL